MERRLYCDSPYTKEWQAVIDDIIQKDGKYHVTLSETAFYPGGGGQPSDRGTIDGIAVEDVYEHGGHVYHVLGSEPQGKAVTCRLDFNRRFDLMQQHTGQHLLSAVLFKLYECKTSSLHMGVDELSIDVGIAEMPVHMITAVEDAVNGYIFKDLLVSTHVMTPQEAGELALRKTPPKEGEIRIVDIDSVDLSPCCGTHVRRAGEIGIIKIVKTEKRGSETRVYFKCGMRALKDYQSKQDIVSGFVRLYRMSESEVLSRTEAQAVQLRNTQKELAELKEKLLGIEAKEMAVAAASPLIIKSFEDKGFEEISKLMKDILTEGEFIVILASIPDRRLLFAKSGNIDVNCGKILKEHLAEFDGKGGGGDKCANAGFKDAEDLRRFEAFLKELLKNIN